jgi:signal transduction histidine kinase
MTIGLETLDLARIHEQALLTLVLPNDLPATRQAIVRRAGIFFAEAITPIEKTHRIAHEANADLKKMIRTLNERSADLAASNRELQRQITQRKAMEESLRRSQQHYGQLLAQEQLRLLSRQLLSAQEQERMMISRELHDVVAQTLTSINVRLANLKKEAMSNTKGLDRKIARTQRLVEKSVNVVHRFARELRPAVLDDLGLIPALHTFLKGFRHETGIRVSLSAFAAVEQVNGDKRTVLYRVAQEALANVARHAQASRAEVKIQKLDDAVCMKIRDNGKGFHEESALRAKRGKRLGLLGMRERLDMVGGKFSIQSTPGRGTTILAQIPLGQAAKAL